MPTEMDSLDLLETVDLAQVGQLEIAARRLVDGFVSGIHRSPYMGCSVEFAEHRPYSPGDEAAMLDWRVYAKSDRYYIKQFEEETNRHAVLVVDSTGSMGFGLSTPSKLKYAQLAAACLGRLMLLQGDGVGLAIADNELSGYIPPRATRSHFGILVNALASANPAGQTSMASVLEELVRRTKRRSLIVLLSDCFEDVDKLIHALGYLQYRGHETLVVHIMAPEEVTFSVGQWTQFESMEEKGFQINLDPGAVRAAYLERMEHFLDRLKSGIGEIGSDYLGLSTDRSVGEALRFYLNLRAAKAKKS